MPRGARPCRSHGEDVHLDPEGKGMLLKDKSDMSGFMGLKGHSGYSVGPRRAAELGWNVEGEEDNSFPSSVLPLGWVGL